MNVNNSMKKYQFFEELIETDTNISTNDKNISSSTLFLKDISSSGINQMQSIDDIIFICGKAIYKVKSQLKRESLIVKIINNKIYDEYRFFNGLYYDFETKFFHDKYYFILLGGELIRYIKNSKEDMLMVTTIKIYDAYNFIEPKYDKYIEDNIEGENYSKSLVKKIEILKKINENEFITGLNSNDIIEYSNYESFQNVISFTIDSNFSFLAIGSTKGEIILISGYPDLIKCDKNKIHMEFLPKIIPKDREIYITNLQFSEFNSNSDGNSHRKILYASTANNIYYYEWKKNAKNMGNNYDYQIKLKILIEDCNGVFNSCLNCKNDNLLISLSNDNYILEYQNLSLKNSYYFEGNKIYVSYFKDYILLITSNIEYTLIQIYDKNNNFLVYSNNTKRKLISVCSNDEFIFIFFEDKQKNKNIVKIKEKENKIKFEIFYSKNQFDIARDYAIKIQCKEDKLAEISRRYAEYEYSKGDYEIAIKQYIKTINYLEPNTVIEKYLEKAKLDYLILYLEAIQQNEQFQKTLKINNKINNIYFAGLLFNCYIVQDKIEKFKNFVESKTKKDNYDLIKKAIDVSIESGNIDMAIYFSQKKDMNEDLIQILILKQNKISEALDYLLPIKKSKNKNKNNDIINEEIKVKEKLNLILKYGQYFLKENNGEISDLFYNRVSSFIEGKKDYLDQKDIIKIIILFIENDKYFKLLFDKIDIYGIEYDEKIIQRRIELYLEEKENNYISNIIKMLKEKKFRNKYNKDNLMILFKYHGFKEGIDILKEISNDKKCLIELFMSQKNYDKLIEILDNIIIKNEKIIEKNKDKFNIDISFIIIILKYFISEKKNNKNKDKKDIDIYIKNILNKLSNNYDSFFPPEFIKILYELNNEFSINDINYYINTIIGKEILSISTYLYHINETQKNLNKIENNIHNLNTKAIKFKLNKCDECNMTINFPCIFYYCGHCYHQTCLNNIKINSRDDKNFNNEEIKCIKCRKPK